MHKFKKRTLRLRFLNLCIAVTLPPASPLEGEGRCSGEEMFHHPLLTPFGVGGPDFGELVWRELDLEN